MYYRLLVTVFLAAKVATLPSRSSGGKAYHVLKPKLGHALCRLGVSNAQPSFLLIKHAFGFLKNLLAIIPSIEIGTLQSVAAEGTLVCDGKPAVGVKVKLYDEDRKHIICL